MKQLVGFTDKYIFDNEAVKNNMQLKNPRLQHKSHDVPIPITNNPNPIKSQYFVFKSNNSQLKSNQLQFKSNRDLIVPITGLEA